MVITRCQTSCGKRFVDFNATDYFKQISIDKLFELAQANFELEPCIDEVVYFCMEENVKLLRFLWAIESYVGTHKETSFNTVVDKNSLFKWLYQNNENHYRKLVEAGYVDNIEPFHSKSA